MEVARVSAQQEARELPSIRRMVRGQSCQHRSAFGPPTNAEVTHSLLAEIVGNALYHCRTVPAVTSVKFSDQR